MIKIFFVFFFAVILTQIILRRSGVERSLLIKSFFNVLIILLLGTSLEENFYSLVSVSFVLLIFGSVLSVIVLSTEEDNLLE